MKRRVIFDDGDMSEEKEEEPEEEGDKKVGDDGISEQLNKTGAEEEGKEDVDLDKETSSDEEEKEEGIPTPYKAFAA